MSSGTLVKTIGFEWMMFGIGILCFCYAPLLLSLKAPPTKEEKKVCSNGIDNAALDTSTEIRLKNPIIIISNCDVSDDEIHHDCIVTKL